MRKNDVIVESTEGETEGDACDLKGENFELDVKISFYISCIMLGYFTIT